MCQKLKKGTTSQPAVSKFDVIINRKDNQRCPCALRNYCFFIADIYFTHAWTC